MRYHSRIPWRRHLFVDCGGQDGCSIRRFDKEFDPAGRFQMVTFEPNDRYASCYAGFSRHRLIQAAVYHRAGTENLFIDRDDGDGSTLFANKLTAVNGGVGTLDLARPLAVQTIDLSSWLFRNTRRFDYVILKLDVEGAEYGILEKMIRHGTIRRIKHLFVEWHWNKIGIPQERHEALLRALRRLRVPILDWDAQGS